MIDVDWRVRETDGVALVAAVVENAAPTPRRIALEPRTDGAVLPPRRRGLPEPGWSDEGFAGIVPAEDRLALGFACRGALEEPPVAVDDEGRAPGDGGRTASADGLTSTAVLRDLGSPVPPRDAVPDGDDAPGPTLADRSGPSSDGLPGPVEGDRSGAAPGRGTDLESRDRPDPVDDRSGNVPRPVADWLDDVAARVDRAERLAAGRDLDAAAAAVETAGGLAGAERLLDALEADEAGLGAVVDRATALADDCDVREDVPVDAYRELA